jgi:DNA repair protein RadC
MDTEDPLSPAVLLPSAEISAEGHRSRLRQRFISGGMAAFAEHEVVELLLTLAIPRRDVKPLAKLLVSRFGSLKGVMDAPLEELAEVPGMGEVGPVAFKIIRATCERYLAEGLKEEVLLNNYHRLEEFWRMRMAGLRHEVIEIAYLDKGYRLLPQGVERLEEGAIDGATLNIQKLFRRALQLGARFIVLAHNHPSGTAEPSAADVELTERLSMAARAVEIELLDHWIITAAEVYSFRKDKRL